MHAVASRRRARVFIASGALALCGFALGAGSLATPRAHADNGTINITYVSPTTFQVKLGTGAVVNSGGTIPAGSYQILVYDSPGEDLNPKINVSGPGVSVDSDLNSTGMGIDVPSTFGPFTLPAGSSYTVQDTIIGASSRMTFTTGGSTGGSTTSATTTTQTTQATTTTQTTTKTTTAATTTTSGPKTIGLITAAVSSSGKLTITMMAMPVKSLKAGTYKITIGDKSKKAGVILAAAGKPPKILSGIAATGTSTHNVTLTRGKWEFKPSSTGPKTVVTVT
jgi:hypothetical protein